MQGMPNFTSEIEEITPQKGKVRILVVSDDPRLCTGFGKVHRYIHHALRQREDFQVVSVGWYPPRDPRAETKKNKGDGPIITNNFGWNIIPCEVGIHDSNGEITVPRTLYIFKPHVVITIGDPWFVKAVCRARLKMDFTWIGYVPIDGVSIGKEHAEVLDKMDYIVAYSGWGRDVIKQCLPHREVHVINHGTDTDIYFPIDRNQAREETGFKSIFGDDFVVGWVARNTPRKRVDIALEAFKWFIEGSLTCKNCNNLIPESKVSEKDFRSAMTCPACNGHLTKVPRKEDVKLYLHCAPYERDGFDIEELMRVYGLDQEVIQPESIRVGVGVTEKFMNKLYNCLDSLINTSEAEGWGMPLHEAMAVGVPVVAPDFGGYLGDLLIHLQTGFLAENRCAIRDPNSGYTRVYVEPRSIAMWLDLIYYYKRSDLETFWKRWNVTEDEPMYQAWKKDERFIDNIIHSAQIRAAELNWKYVGDQWVHFVDQVAVPKQKERIKDYLKSFASQDQKIVFAISDLASHLDAKAFGPELTFNQTLGKIATLAGYEVIHVGYAKNRMPNTAYGMFKDTSYGDAPVHRIEAVYGAGGSDEFVEAARPSVIFAHGFGLPEACRLSKKYNIPMVSFVYHWEGICGNSMRMATCHLNCSSCSAFLDKTHEKVFNSFMEALEHSEVIVFPSQFAKNLFFGQWGKAFKNKDKKSLVLYPSVDTTDTNVMFTAEDEINPEFITLMRGREEKGSLVFIDIANQMKDRKFLIVDVDDQVTVENLGNQKHIIGVRKTTEVARIYSRTDLVVVPSLTPDMFSRVAIEAIANGIPVLASSVGAMSEFLPLTALIREYWDSNAWVTAIRDLKGKKRTELIRELQDAYKRYRENSKQQQINFEGIVRSICSKTASAMEPSQSSTQSCVDTTLESSQPEIV